MCTPDWAFCNLQVAQDSWGMVMSTSVSSLAWSSLCCTPLAAGLLLEPSL